MNVSLHLRMRARAGDLERHIRRPRYRIVEAGESCGRGDVHMVEVHARREGTALGELSFLQSGADVEIGAGVAAVQRTSAKG